VAEPEADRRRIIVQARRAARLLAQGQDGTRLLPPELRFQAASWRQSLAMRNQKLDQEGWLLGLLTLACLSGSATGGLK
jgi:hypothetical protein